MTFISDIIRLFKSFFGKRNVVVGDETGSVSSITPKHRTHHQPWRYTPKGLTRRQRLRLEAHGVPREFR